MVESHTVADLNLVLNLGHPFRNDVLAWLTSPGGTSVQLLSVSTWASVYSLMLDDAALLTLSTNVAQAISVNFHGSCRIKWIGYFG